MSDSGEAEKKRALILAGMDQAGAMMAEAFPPVLHGFYVKMVEQGFTDAQAMSMTEVLMLKMLDVGTS